jgi:glycosyltransferase involved in cell wall biosynthesis
MPPEIPLVSIVVPAYNAELFLRASLDSILSQTYPATEVLLMDDASTDSTPAIARSYGDRIIYYRQPRNRGQFANVSDGISRARGKYVAVYHADDIYLAEIVAREVSFLEAHSEAGAVFAIEIFIDREGCERGRLVLPPEVRGRELLDYATVLNALLCYKNRIFCGPSSMIPAAVYRTIGPFRGQEFPVAGDFEMFFRIARKYPVGILDQHLMRYRWGHGNADQLDRLLRTTPEPYFSIMDEHLAAGGRALARKSSLAAHEAHRSEDAVMRAVNCYILNRPRELRQILKEVSLRRLLGSSKVQRFRLSVLYLFLLILARLPHLPVVARLFRNRWYSRAEESAFNKMARTRVSIERAPGS